mgnify:CR=1 FL=1
MIIMHWFIVVRLFLYIMLRYKGFEFSAMLILDAGHKLRSSNIPSINMSNGRITSTAKGIVDRWTQPGDVTDVPRLLFSNDTENFNTHRTELYRYSDLFVYDASNIGVQSSGPLVQENFSFRRSSSVQCRECSNICF